MQYVDILCSKLGMPGSQLLLQFLLIKESKSAHFFGKENIFW